METLQALNIIECMNHPAIPFKLRIIGAYGIDSDPGQNNTPMPGKNQLKSQALDDFFFSNPALCTASRTV